jgi:patatin-related protein
VDNKTDAGKSEICKKSQEIRLGLVMYGGVSLAIYIFGVTQEFFRTVRGRGVYRFLKDLTDSDIVVDIVSGTSAGGVNGILLAYALCNEKEISKCNDLWRDAGDIMQLIHDPHTPVENVRSVLNSQFYLKKMKEGLETMPAIQNNDDHPSQLRELDLFLTGTNVYGKVYTWFDDQGHAIDIKDHRSVFILKHRANRKAPFKPDDTTHHALAKLARITSCFPVAFQPVNVSGDQKDAAADSLLQQWGNLDKSKEQYFLDGGVLDNKPFTHTIREIFYRLADRKVDRKLFYIEPDPERFAPEQAQPITEPPVLATALKSLITIPGYESIAEDLKLLAERNEKVKRYNRLVDRLDPKTLQLSADTEACINRIRASERGGIVEEKEQQPCLYAQTRLVELSERVVRGVLRKRGQDVQLTGEPRKAAELLYRAFDTWSTSGEDTLFNFDVYFRLRRLFHVLYRIKPPEPGAMESDPALRAAAAIGQQIMLLEVIQAGMERMLGKGPFRWEGRKSKEVWDEVNGAFRIMLDAEGLLPQEYASQWMQQDPGRSWLNQSKRGEIKDQLWHRSDDVLKQLANGKILVAPASFVSAFAATDACEQRMLKLLDQDLLEVYDNFIKLDAQLYPLEVFGNLREKDIIETVRISPFDAQLGFSKRPGNDKVSGDVLGHFGGFLKRSWRSNDIMWGRLDGLCQIVETLLTPLRLRQVIVSNMKIPLLKQITDDAYLKDVFPHATDEERTDIKNGLHQMLTEPLPAYDENKPDEFVHAFTEKFGFDNFLSRIVQAAQREILEQEVPRVIADSIEQQAKWNQYKITDQEKKKVKDEKEFGFDVKTQSFYYTGPGNLDGLVITAASEQLAGKLIEKQGGAAALFIKGGVQVGSESVKKDIPAAVIMETAAKGLLSLRHAIISTATSAISKRVSDSTTNRWFGFFLWAFYGFASFMRRSKPGAKFLIIGLTILAALALVVGIKWWAPIVYSESSISWVALGLFIVIPLLYLVGELFWFWKRWKGLARLALALVVAVLLGGVGYWAWGWIRGLICGICGAG